MFYDAFEVQGSYDAIEIDMDVGEMDWFDQERMIVSYLSVFEQAFTKWACFPRCWAFSLASKVASEALG